MIVLVLSPFHIQSHLALLEMLPEGSQAHNHVRRALNDVAGLGVGPAANGQANNGHEIEPTATASPSTSTAPVSTRTRGQLAIASPSTSAARGRVLTATTSPSTSAARGCGMPATASPSRSVARGCKACYSKPKHKCRQGLWSACNNPSGCN